MRDRDPYDEFLLHCSSDIEPAGRLPRSADALQPQLCADCREQLKPHFRFCPNCGCAIVVPGPDENPYNLPRRQIGQLFEVTLLGITPDINSVEEPFADEESPDPAADDEEPPRFHLAHLRIVNRAETRLCVSLTFSQSALIDQAGRQYLPVLREEDDEDGLLDGWFYLYPGAWVEGSLLFPEPATLLRHCYVSCQPQDREEELFHFTLS